MEMAGKGAKSQLSENFQSRNMLFLTIDDFFFFKIRPWEGAMVPGVPHPRSANYNTDDDDEHLRGGTRDPTCYRAASGAFARRLYI